MNFYTIQAVAEHKDFIIFTNVPAPCSCSVVNIKVRNKKSCYNIVFCRDFCRDSGPE